MDAPYMYDAIWNIMRFRFAIMEKSIIRSMYVCTEENIKNDPELQKLNRDRNRIQEMINRREDIKDIWKEITMSRDYDISDYLIYNNDIMEKARYYEKYQEENACKIVLISEDMKEIPILYAQ
jgi:trans-2-enoyl-CoA reductase